MVYRSPLSFQSLPHLGCAGTYLDGRDENDYWVHQYISSRAELNRNDHQYTLLVAWHGEITIQLR